MGQASVVGENGWELFVPDRPGRIYNQDQLGAASSGNTTVIVQQTIQVGSVVSRAEHERDLLMIEERARKGAIAGVLDTKSRGGVYRSAFRR